MKSKRFSLKALLSKVSLIFISFDPTIEKYFVCVRTAQPFTVEQYADLSQMTSGDAGFGSTVV